MKETSSIWLFLKFAKKYKKQFMISFLLMPIYAWLAVKGPALIQHAIDYGISKNDLSLVIKNSWFYLLVLISMALIQATQNILLQTGGLRALKDLRAKIVFHISHLGKKDYDSRPLGVHLSRATSDVENIGETFLQGITYIISDFLVIISVFIYIFLQNTHLGLVTLILIPIIVFTINWFRIKLRLLYDNIRSLNGKLSSQLNEAFSMLFEINIFNLRQSFINEFKNTNDEYMEKSIKSINLDAIIYSLLDGFLFICIGAILIFLCLVPSILETISIGFIVAYIQLLQQLFEPVKEMGSRFAVLQSALAALGKISSTLSIPLPEDKGIKKIECNDIIFDSVTFSYKENEPVLKNLSLHIPSGNNLAIVGPTGSGKSTIIRLLSRQYEIEKGKISFGNISIQDISRFHLKEKMVLVPQEPAIFHNSVKFNISLNRSEISDNQVIDICKAIGIDSFISSLTFGYETILEEGGNNLSVGQRQLIALARALVSSAEILIFDEATANIDTKTELQIQQAMNYAMKTKTCIIIAHRLSTIKNADKIIVLQKGQVIDEGTHNELIKRDGLYKSMYELQISK